MIANCLVSMKTKQHFFSHAEGLNYRTRKQTSGGEHVNKDVFT